MKTKIKNNSKNNIISIVFKVLIMVVFITLLFTQYVLAGENYFTIEIPKGYKYSHYEEGEMKLQAIREDGKLNFNIQVYNTEEYTDYSQEGLSDLIRIASKSTTEYSINSVTGKINTINEYPCYDLSYVVTARENDNEMYVRQIYLYEDKYSYIITIGGESNEILNEEEIQKAMDTFIIEDYKRENVIAPEKEKMNTVLVVILIVGGIVVIVLIIAVIVKKLKNCKNKKNNNIKREVTEVEVAQDVVDLQE